jgi:hypothetical protein
MKKMLTLLALAAFPATFGGCAACCPTGAVCPCCPCNWFNRPAAVCPPTYAAPLAAAPYCPPAVAPMPQYVTPMAAPVAAAAPCCPAPCATWNPCQGTAVMAQPQAACCPPQAMQPMSQPMYYQQAQPAMMDPGCGYAGSSFGAPFAGMVSYGPEMPVEYGGCCDSGCCDSGCCEGGGVIAPPAPETFVEPQPVAE